jgi:L-amino acid N-acyltransferase YncA
LTICYETEFNMINISAMLPEHWEPVKKIYEEGIATGNATFQTSAPSWEDWDGSHMKNCRIIATENNEVLGWAALTPVSSRCVYAGVAEVSVYVATKARGKKIGSLLLQELTVQSEQNGIWTLQSGIFPENKASITIHEKNGFRVMGYREKIGKMGNVWRDNVILERRSQIIGVD